MIQVTELVLGGVALTLLALVGIVWAGRADGFAALSRASQAVDLGPWLRRRGREGLWLFSVFVGIALLTHLASVRALDTLISHRIYHHDASVLTRGMVEISVIGGRDLLMWGIPLLLGLLYLAGRARSVRFFGSTMFGTLGLETVFKTLFHRLRPEFGGRLHRLHFDSFPSGHTLAATILAGSLLLILLPLCRRPWQRGLLRTLALLWPVLMGISRVYLGRHYPTDVLGGMLLGAAWVLLCEMLLLTVAALTPG